MLVEMVGIETRFGVISNMRGKEIKEGERYGYFTVIKRTDIVIPKYGRQYVVRCVCGKEITHTGHSVKAGKIKSCGCKKGESRRSKDRVGERFERLVVLRVDKSSQIVGRNTRWVCQCDCGNIKTISDQHFGRTRSCGCVASENTSKRQRATRKMFQEMPIEFVTRVRIGATDRGKAFEITAEDIWNQYIKQNKCCYFTNLSIGFMDDIPNSYGIKTHTASLDRIDSTKGYIKDNICLVHKDINTMKMDLPMETFLRYAQLIARKWPLSS